MAWNDDIQDTSRRAALADRLREPLLRLRDWLATHLYPRLPKRKQETEGAPVGPSTYPLDTEGQSHEPPQVAVAPSIAVTPVAPDAPPATSAPLPVIVSMGEPTITTTMQAQQAMPDAFGQRRRARNGFQLALHLAQRPGFCCCCWCIGPKDARRARHIFALVRAIKRAERKARRD
ncbi:MAG: hypothetical protein JNM89_14935 [Hyphomicrobiaceae bacterium]|nr:hypothetical protein [Hyphomicrobiaceae bacterium]